MTTKIIFGSNKLGNIRNEQLQAMLVKFKLGTLLSAKKTEQGAMGQTMFIISTKGEFVFKGNPLYKGQLEEEKYFIEQLRQRTEVPVPIPYLIDDSTDIFGWKYALMPLLKGKHLTDSTLQHTMNTKDKCSIAQSIADALFAFHQWKVEDFGELDTHTLKITPFKTGYYQWLFDRILFWLEDARKYSKVTHDDLQWTKNLLEDSKEAFQRITSPTFVMGDFKPGNFLVQQKESSWSISGVFDFTNSFFGDPVSDLVKMLTYYLDNNEKVVAKHLVDAYFDKLTNKVDSITRLKVHMLHQKVLDWGNAKATKTVTWYDELPFYHWAGEYTQAMEDLFR